MSCDIGTLWCKVLESCDSYQWSTTFARPQHSSPPNRTNERLGEHITPLDYTTGQLDSLIPYISAQTWKDFLIHGEKPSVKPRFG
jgi:hypothetical protein